MPFYTATSPISSWPISSDYRIAALQGDLNNNQHYVWTGLGISYSFPEGPSYFNNNSSYGLQNEVGAGWGVLTAAEKASVRTALQAWSNVSSITFVEVDDDQYVGDMRFALTSAVPTSKFGHAYQPAPNVPESGDVWLTTRWAGQDFGGSPSQTNGAVFLHNPDIAIKYQTLMHEIGHALGLSHPHQESGKTRYTAPLPVYEDSLKATVMSYAPYTGQLGAFDRGIPTTPMPYDILAIQHMYGANLTYNKTDTVYKFDMSDVRLETIWDAGGNDTIMATNQYNVRINDTFSRDPNNAFSGPNLAGYRGVQIDLREAQGINPLDRGVFGGAAGNTIGHVGQYASTWVFGGYVYYSSLQTNIYIAFNAKIENAIGTSHNDKLIGNELSNRLTGGGGHDRMDGMGGIDTAVYSDSFSNYTVTRTSFGYEVQGKYLENYTTPGGVAFSNNPVDQLQNIERIEFSDRNLAFDLAVNQSAGKTARIIGALLDTSQLTPQVAGMGISLFDQGQSMLSVAQLILNHPLYLQWAGSSSNSAMVLNLFKNIANTVPSTADLQYYTGLLDRGEVSQAQLAVTAAESSFNEANIGLVGLQNSGLAFIPFAG